MGLLAGFGAIGKQYCAHESQERPRRVNVRVLDVPKVPGTSAIDSGAGFLGCCEITSKGDMCLQSVHLSQSGAEI